MQSLAAKATAAGATVAAPEAAGAAEVGGGEAADGASPAAGDVGVQPEAAVAVVVGGGAEGDAGADPSAAMAAAEAPAATEPTNPAARKMLATFAKSEAREAKLELEAMRRDLAAAQADAGREREARETMAARLTDLEALHGEASTRAGEATEALGVLTHEQASLPSSSSLGLPSSSSVGLPSSSLGLPSSSSF